MVAIGITVRRIEEQQADGLGLHQAVFDVGTDNVTEYGRSIGRTFRIQFHAETAAQRTAGRQMLGQLGQSRTGTAAGIENADIAAADIEPCGNAGQGCVIGREIAVVGMIVGNARVHQMVLRHGKGSCKKREPHGSGLPWLGEENRNRTDAGDTV